MNGQYMSVPTDVKLVCTSTAFSSCYSYYVLHVSSLVLYDGQILYEPIT